MVYQGRPTIQTKRGTLEGDQSGNFSYSNYRLCILTISRGGQAGLLEMGRYICLLKFNWGFSPHIRGAQKARSLSRTFIWIGFLGISWNDILVWILDADRPMNELFMILTMILNIDGR